MAYYCEQIEDFETNRLPYDHDSLIVFWLVKSKQVIYQFT